MRRAAAPIVVLALAGAMLLLLDRDGAGQAVFPSGMPTPAMGPAAPVQSAGAFAVPLQAQPSGPVFGAPTHPLAVQRSRRRLAAGQAAAIALNSAGQPRRRSLHERTDPRAHRHRNDPGLRRRSARRGGAATKSSPEMTQEQRETIAARGSGKAKWHFTKRSSGSVHRNQD